MPLIRRIGVVVLSIIFFSSSEAHIDPSLKIAHQSIGGMKGELQKQKPFRYKNLLVDVYKSDARLNTGQYLHGYVLVFDYEGKRHVVSTLIPEGKAVLTLRSGHEVDEISRKKYPVFENILTKLKEMKRSEFSGGVQ